MFSLWIEKIILPLHPQIKRRAFSSAGLEHLPYKQRVGGSNPSTPTSKSLHSYRMQGLCFHTLLVKTGVGVTMYIILRCLVHVRAVVMTCVICFLDILYVYECHVSHKMFNFAATIIRIII